MTRATRSTCAGDDPDRSRLPVAYDARDVGRHAERLGLVNISVQVGGAIGLAVLARLATERTAGQLADGESAAAALNSGYHLAYLIGAGLVLVAIAVSVLRSPVSEAGAEPVTEVSAEPVEGPPARAVPPPADVASGGGCVETGMRVVIGCAGC